MRSLNIDVAYPSQTAIECSSDRVTWEWLASQQAQEEMNTSDRRVCAIIPHWQCEDYLEDCLKSLVTQNRPLDGIVVVDDGSPVVPVHIVKQLPGVELWHSRERVGPYRLINQVIRQSPEYDLFLFQDADDWSASDRLSVLLNLMEQTGADLVGSQEVRIYESSLKALGCYPLDVNAALKLAPGNAFLHPTGLITRDFYLKVGGFCGWNYAGDCEFLYRAQFAGKIVNSPKFCYFRRKRSDSLTGAAETGMQSMTRLSRIQQAVDRANLNQALESPDLSPLEPCDPVELIPLSLG